MSAKRSTARRAFVIVMDSVGVGHAPDAADFGDAGAATLQHTADAVGGLELPNLDALGLRRIVDYRSPLPQPETVGGAYGVMREASPDKDSTTGHWELMGLPTTEPFPTFPEGFPPAVMDEFSRRTGCGWLWNRPASGTEIIERYGLEHITTGKLIVYTSADSVFQIAAHEDVVPPAELYRICRITRELLDPLRVSRVIARPFVGDSPDNFERTANRRDFSVEPPADTVLDALQAAGVRTVGVGKIGDLFAGVGLDEDHHTTSNADGMAKTTRFAETLDAPAFIFTNLVDFDSRFGHRRNPRGYAGALVEFDAWLGSFRELLRTDDLLLITADHGCDPTYKGTDHTRERVPLLVYRPRTPGGVELGLRDSFCDVGRSTAAWFGVDWPRGKSFLPVLGIE